MAKIFISNQGHPLIEGAIYRDRKNKEFVVKKIRESYNTESPYKVCLKSITDGITRETTLYGSYYSDCNDHRDIIEKLVLEKQTDMNYVMPLNQMDSFSTKKYMVTTDQGQFLGIYESEEEAVKKAKQGLRQDNAFYIFKAISKVSPKPIDAEIEEY